MKSCRAYGFRRFIKGKNAAVLAGTLLFLTGCGAGPDAAQVSSAGEVQQAAGDSTDVSAAVSVQEVYDEITQAVSLASPVCMDDEFILNYYGIDAAADLEEYVFSMSEDAAKAETVVVMKAKEGADLDALADSLQVVVDEKKLEMENYLPEQYAIVEKSKVQTKENYVWLVISEQADAILDIIESKLF